MMRINDGPEFRKSLGTISV